jgi:drug/metabolite transporter (DMT)-like permease
MTTEHLDLTVHPIGILALAIFAIAYVLVVVEEAIHLRKSKPVLLAGGLIWALIGIAYSRQGRPAVSRRMTRQLIRYLSMANFSFSCLLPSLMSIHWRSAVYSKFCERGW